MIFYFSGTGNSKWVASEIAKVTGDGLIDICRAIGLGLWHYELKSGERVGVVFPVHSWGPAPIVAEYMSKISIGNYSERDGYAYAVAVCGDDIGETMEIMGRSMPQGIELKGKFSVQMPNNYILLPGFDTDGVTEELRKLTAAKSRVGEVSDAIAERRCRCDVVRGGMAKLKSRVVYRLYKRYGKSDSRFFAEEEKCTSCGLCVKKCESGNIEMHEGRPRWKGRCEMCLACIHYCPARAIEYGKLSRGKGRYHIPQSYVE